MGSTPFGATNRLLFRYGWIEVGPGYFKQWNRTNKTYVTLNAEQEARWRKWMAFQKQQRGKSKFAGNRLTGLFKSRNKKGLYVGTARPDDVDGLIDKIKTAKKVGRGLTFFLWKNDIQSANTPVFSLSCDVAQERKVERAIEEDDEGDFVENESEPEDDDDPFA